MKHLAVTTLLIILLDISMSVAVSDKGLSIIRRPPRPPHSPKRNETSDENWLSKLLEKIEEIKEQQKREINDLLDQLKKRKCRDGECEWTTTMATKSAEKDDKKSFEDWLKGILEEKHNGVTRPNIPTKEEMKEKIKQILEDMKEEEQKQKNQKNQGVENVQTMSPTWDNVESAMADSRADNMSLMGVPQETGNTEWWNSFWFWLIHVIGVVIIIVLIIVICVMCTKRRKHYERLA